MGQITLSDNIFKSSDYLFSKVKRFLKSYDFANIIDEGEFPTYTKEVLKTLGWGILKETQGILKIEDGECILPDNFEYYYSGYKIDNPTYNKTDTVQSNFSFVTDVTKDYILESNSCSINACENSKQLVESINIKTFVRETNESFNCSYSATVPLVLSPNVRSKAQKKFDDGHIYGENHREISIDKQLKRIYTNFDKGTIYMKYYGFPIDEDGNMEIPDIEQVEKAIEWYIIYQILLSQWFNSTVPDIQNKYMKAEQEYKLAYSEAKHYLKLPSFMQMVNTLRNTRSQNKLVFMTEQYNKSGYQRTR